MLLSKKLFENYPIEARDQMLLPGLSLTSNLLAYCRIGDCGQDR
jgi:hypothetical protein